MTFSSLSELKVDKVDKKEQATKGSRWQWLAEAMPMLPRRMKELRAEHGADHVAECWRRGVVELEPGWFFARQGAVCVGAPFVGDPALSDFASMHLQADQCLVVIRPKGAAHGS